MSIYKVILEGTRLPAFDRTAVCSSTLLLAAFLTLPAWGEDTAPSHQRSAVPLDARYEIVQSPLVSRAIFKLDKYTGSVAVLTRAADGTFSWQAMLRADHPLDKMVPGKVNYEFFSSGLIASATFLINVNTGATWVLTEDPKHQLYWAAVPQ